MVTCKPCITELNALNEVMEEWLEDVDFDIIAVSVDDSRFSSRARSMAQGYDWQFKCVFDKNQDLKRAMNVSLTPQTFITDASGKIVYSHSGYTPENDGEDVAYSCADDCCFRFVISSVRKELGNAHGKPGVKQYILYA